MSPRFLTCKTEQISEMLKDNFAAMEVTDMEGSTRVDDYKTRNDQTMETNVKFCQLSLARGKSLAVQGQPEWATRELRAVEDTADSIKKVLAKAEDQEFLDRWMTQLAEIQRGVNELSSKLDIPPERKNYHFGRIELNGGV